MVDETVHLGIGFIKLFEFPGALQGLFQCHTGTGRHHFGDLIHIPKRHIGDTAHIPDDRSRRQGAEGNDLGHLVLAVLPGQIIDDLSPPPVAEVRINIRHGHTLGVQETFEEKVKTERIDFRNMKEIGHNASCRTAAARTDGDAMGLGIMDEIHDDEEIVRKAHVLDDSQLIVQPFLLLSRRMGIPLRQRLLAELSKIGGGRLSLRHVKRGQLMVPEGQGHMAAVRYLLRILNGAGILSQNGFHFRPALAVELIIGKMEMVGIIQRFPCRNTELDFLAPCIFLPGVVEIVGGHQAKAILPGQRCQHRTHRRFFRKTVILELDEIIVLPESIHIELDHLPGLLHIMVQNGLGQLAAYAGRERDEALMVLLQQLMVRPGFEIIPLRPGFGADFDEVLIALIILRQKNQMSQLLLLSPCPLLKPASPGHIDLAADDGLDSLGHAFLVQIHRPVHDPMVRNGQSRLSHILHMGHQFLNAAGAIKQAVFCMHMKMNEWIHGPS